MKAHIREEKKTTPLKLGEGILLQEKDGKMYKICDTAEYDETHTDDEVIKFALSEENLLSERVLWFIYGANNVYVNRDVNMHKTDSLKNPVIIFPCKNCGCTTKIRVASFENPDLDIPENNVIACYRCRAEVAGSEFISWKEATKTIFTVEVSDGC